MGVETEVKFYLDDINAIKERITGTGAQSSGRVFETNIRFEDAANSLIARNALLRLRQDRKATLTFKCEPDIADKEFKTYQEFEVGVSDFTAARQLINALGFHEAQVYEKYRETFTLKDTYLCLDTMPFGDFLEIEGDKAAIRALAQRLDLPWENRILTNYLNIFATIKANHGLGFNDVTFENFAAIESGTSPGRFTGDILAFRADAAKP